jgi:hypothetical protein
MALPAMLLQPDTSSDSSKPEVVLPLAMATPHDHLRQTAATVMEPIQDNPTSLTSLVLDLGLHGQWLVLSWGRGSRPPC